VRLVICAQPISSNKLGVIPAMQEAGGRKIGGLSPAQGGKGRPYLDK
jgi:hypothetical protein